MRRERFFKFYTPLKDSKFHVTFTNLNNSLSPDNRFEKSGPCSTMGVYDKMIPLAILLNVLNTHAVFIFTST